MRILLYGFKPFLHYKENVTEKVLRKIKKKKNLKKVVFDVKFNKKQFIDEIKSFRPDIIIGLGQHPRGKMLRNERKAVNSKKYKKKDRPKPINPKGEDCLFSTLKVKRSKRIWYSHDAGEYVCNFSMYVILDHIRSKDIQFTFIHIPQDYDVNKVVRYLKKLIDTF